MGRDNQSGFSLVELLVVIVIVSLLAAIAIPLFLAQRERAWNVQTTSALRNAATAMDAGAVGNGGSYVGLTIPRLVANEGLKYARTVVDLAVESANVRGYCLSARHTISLETIYWDSSQGRPSPQSCAANYL